MMHPRTRSGREGPALKIMLLDRLARQLSANLRRTNQEIAAYRG